MHDEGKIIPERFYNAHSSRTRIEIVKPEPKIFLGRWLFRFSLIILILCSIFWLFLKFAAPQLLPLRDVRVVGHYPHVNQSLLRQTVLPFTQKGLLGVDVNALRDQLLQIPWVYNAQIRRIWPDTLRIVITEQQPVAFYNADALLNPQAELFHADLQQVPVGLPHLVGPLNQQATVWTNYQQMSQILAADSLKITQLTLDSRQAWQLQLDNGVNVLLGRTNPIERLQRFAKAYPQIKAAKAAPITAVDLRYPHGIAVTYASNSNN